jgi:inner membrane transporter RhtA
MRRPPPHAYFVTSAVFHYLGPAFAVLLFTRVGVLGVAWLRIAAAALVFAIWRRPWRLLRQPAILALGVVLGGMNALFYLSIDRLPLGTVGAIEFVGPIVLAALGARSIRNAAALLLAVGGVWLLTDVRLVAEPLGFAFAFGNAVLFTLYIVLGDRIAKQEGSGIDRLAASMLVALVVVSPIGFVEAAATFTHPVLLAAGAGVGICSSVIPYVCDQLAMARLPRSTFALLLALLPATATVIGVVVLTQFPTWLEVLGVALVVAAVLSHRGPEQRAEPPGPATHTPPNTTARPAGTA